MAVEDGSSSNPDRQKDIVKPVSEEAATLVRQSFVDKVRTRMQSSEVSWMKLLAGEANESKSQEDDKSKEDEEDDYSPASEKKRSAKRFPRIRGLLIPRPQTIKDESPTESRVMPQVARQAENIADNEPVMREDLSIAAHGSAHTHTEAERGVSGRSEAVYNSAEESTPEQGDFIDIANTPTESLHTILQRRHQANMADFSVVQSPDNSRVGVVGESSPRSRGDNAATTVERTLGPAGALLAVDVLNYAVARRRDAKNEAASVKRDKHIISDQKQQAAQFNSELNRQYAYQKELSSRIEKSEKQQSARLPKVDNVELRPNITENPRHNVEKNTSSTEFIRSKNEQYKVVEKSVEVAERVFGSAPDISRPDVETVLHAVEQAAEKNVPIEAQYELRHEHKGNDAFSIHNGQSADLRVSGGGQNGGHGSSLGHVATQAKLEQSSGGQGAPVYKQVASTGALGAVVGVLLFIVLYILTR